MTGCSEGCRFLRSFDVIITCGFIISSLVPSEAVMPPLPE